MQTSLILTHEDLLTTRQVFYRQKENLEAFFDSVTHGAVNPGLLDFKNYIDQICSQLDERIAALDLKSAAAIPSITAAQLSRVTSKLSGNVLVNGNANITISIVNNDINITQP